MSERAQPVGGPIFTKPYRVVTVFAIVGLAMIAWRLIAGLGVTTNLSDGYPWGLWISFDVLTGTALACGGYAVAILVYILNKGRYHHLIRPAILTSALGYSLAGLSIVLDVGRWWNIWKMPLFWTRYNFNSVLLEVALCIMAYTVVLWIEVSPAFFEKWREGSNPTLRKISNAVLPRLEKALIWIIALGLLLPTMHQSSLGSLFLVAVKKLHPLWHTGFLPLLFLLTAVSMGYAAVVLEATLSSYFFRRKPETAMLASLGRAIAGVNVAFLVVRFADLGVKGRLGLTVSEGGYSLLFWAETLLFLVPVFMFARADWRRQPTVQFRAAMMMAIGGGLYRFGASLLAYDPGPGWSYFPSVAETFVTTGLVAIEIMAFVAIAKRFPILAGASRPAAPTPAKPGEQPAGSLPAPAPAK